MVFDLAQKHYFAEIDRRDKLNASAALAVTIFAAFSALAASLFEPRQFVDGHWLRPFLLTTALLSGAWAFKNFAFFFGFNYRYIEIKLEILSWVDELNSHFGERSSTKALVKEAFEKELAQDYLECVEHNAKVNDFKASAIYRTNFYLLFAVTTCIINWLLKAWL